MSRRNKSPLLDFLQDPLYDPQLSGMIQSYIDPELSFILSDEFRSALGGDDYALTIVPEFTPTLVRRNREYNNVLLISISGYELRMNEMKHEDYVTDWSVDVMWVYYEQMRQLFHAHGWVMTDEVYHKPGVPYNIIIELHYDVSVVIGNYILESIDLN
jgi:hypothetical protein